MISLETPHQLLILGNGFDLFCGLESRYSDFFDFRLAPILNETLNKVSAVPYNFYKSNLTVWDLFFALLGPLKEPSPSIGWCDIEYVIGQILGSSGENGHNRAKYDFRDLNADEIYSALNSQKNVRLQDETLCVVQYLNYRNVEFSSKADLFAFLFSELNRFERAFANYLKVAVRRCNRYELDSKLLLRNLIASGMDDRVTDATILNFNYTHPQFMRNDVNVAKADYINIHGRYNGDIIFGIDGTGLIMNDRLMPFTKTYRLMASHRMDLREPVSRPRSESSNAPGTVVVKFFGHSLAEADYSYFQSIFDNLNLYGGSVSLVFYYAPYCSTAETDLQKSVIKLLSSYGDTMNNRDHGDNLIHKLLLEGRISVKRVPE